MRPTRPGRGTRPARPARPTPTPAPAEPDLDDLDPAAGEDGEDAEPALPELKVDKVKVSVRRDVLTLADGAQVVGNIVAVGRKAVIIITPTGEETIPRSRVVKIDRGASRFETLEHREYEIEYAEGHARVIVPVGMDAEEDEPGPPGLIPGSKVLRAGLSRVQLGYKPRPGTGLSARLDVRQADVEDPPGKPRAERVDQAFVTVRPLVTKAMPGGAWTVVTTFRLRRLIRGGADVTKLEAPIAKTARIERSLSRAGVWQPGADKVSGAGRDPSAYVRWLSYVLVPVPRGPASFGRPVELKAVIPQEIARQMLPLPDPVAGLPWTVGGEYEVKGVARVGGQRRAMIEIDLHAEAAGDGQYRGEPKKLRVTASAKWEVQFAIDAGHPAEIRVAGTTEVFDAANDGAKLLTRRLEVAGDIRSAQHTAPGKQPGQEADPGREAGPAKPGDAPKPPPAPKGDDDPDPELEKALDDLMDKLNRPGFFDPK
jgi:hypothetical protein